MFAGNLCIMYGDTFIGFQFIRETFWENPFTGFAGVVRYDAWNPERYVSLFLCCVLELYLHVNEQI